MGLGALQGRRTSPWPSCRAPSGVRCPQNCCSRNLSGHLVWREEEEGGCNFVSYCWERKKHTQECLGFMFLLSEGKSKQPREGRGKHSKLKRRKMGSGGTGR